MRSCPGCVASHSMKSRLFGDRRRRQLSPNAPPNPRLQLMRRQADVKTVLSGAATREHTVVPDFLSARERLLAEAARFVRNARGLPGACRIALLGSVLTD